MIKDILKMSFIVLAILIINAMATNVLTIPALKKKSTNKKTAKQKIEKLVPSSHIASLLFRSVSN